jgi:uncharacterized protein YdaU (DUF1376 family)
MHYYKFNIADYRKDTGHLTTVEHGIYRQLIDWQYLHETPIPLETDMVMRRLRLVTGEFINLQNVLSEFFKKTEKGYIHQRIFMELKDYQEKTEKNKINGKLGGRPKKTQVVIEKKHEETELKAKSKATHKPINSLTNKNIEKHPAVSQEVWDLFVAQRKTKKANLSQLVMRNIVSEASIAGWTVEAALQEIIVRNWTSFKAEWVAHKKSFAEQQLEKDRSEFNAIIRRTT